MNTLKPAQAVWLAWRQGPSATWSLGHVAKDHYQTLCGKPIPMNAVAAPNAITKCHECRELENKQNVVQTLVDVFGSENVIRPETHPHLIVKSEAGSETKFTPGPWMVGKPDTEMGSVLIGVNLDDQSYGFSIADVCSGSPAEIEKTLSDARLIAAAPDLYSALNAMLDMFSAVAEKVDWGKSFLGSNEIRKFNEAPIQAKRALAKARGE